LQPERFPNALRHRRSRLVVPIERKARVFKELRTFLDLAVANSEIGSDIGWHTFRHSYRSWLDETGAPLTVQKELMRHASIQTR